MKNLIGLAFILVLSGCATFSETVTKEMPLHQVINEIKAELSLYKGQVHDNKDKYTFGCGDDTNVDPIEIKNIKVTVAVTEELKREGGGGAQVETVVNISGSAKGSSSSTDSDKLELNFAPQTIPPKNGAIQGGGIAEALLALTSELSKVNKEEPCLKGGLAKVTLGFEAKSTSEQGGEIGLFVFSIEGKKSTSKSYANTIELTLDLGGTVFN